MLSRNAAARLRTLAESAMPAMVVQKALSLLSDPRIGAHDAHKQQAFVDVTR
jgi:hypothetical protein